MSATLEVIDSTQTLVEDIPAVRVYELEALIEGVLGAEDASELGPGLHALYAQTLVALHANPTLNGLVDDITEGRVDEDDVDPEGASLELAIARLSAIDGGGECTGGFTLQVTMGYERRAGTPSRRDAILSALKTQLDTNQPDARLCVLERVTAALVSKIEAALGGSILRNADRPEEEDGAVIFVDGHVRVDHSVVGRTTYRKSFAVEVITTDEAALEADTAKINDAVYGAGTLDGIAADTVEESIDPDVDDTPYTGGGVFGVVSGVVTFSTIPGNPYVEAD